MNQIASLLFIFSSVAILPIATAQERAPHGLANESPLTFPPSAVEFFHPKRQEPETANPCASSKCSPLPVAAQVEATQTYESRVPTTSQKSGSRLTTGGITSIVVGSALVALLAVGAYYVVITRRANVNRANSVQPNV